jgi:hypothetical protein
LATNASLFVHYINTDKYQRLKNRTNSMKAILREERIALEKHNFAQSSIDLFLKSVKFQFCLLPSFGVQKSARPFLGNVSFYTKLRRWRY